MTKATTLLKREAAEMTEWTITIGVGFEQCYIFLELNVSNCPMVLAVVVLLQYCLVLVYQIDDPSSCSTVSVDDTVNCCCHMKNSSFPTAKSKEMVNFPPIPFPVFK